MNGYFNNLALRSMNAGNLVEPRLPSLFEPQRGELDAATAVYSEPRSASRPASTDAPPPPTESPLSKVSIEESPVAEKIIRQQPAVTTARPSSKSDEPPAPVVPSPREDHTATTSFAELSPLEALSTTQTASQTAPDKTTIAPEAAIKSVQSVLPRPDETVHSEEVTIRPENLPALPPAAKAITTSEVEEHVSLVEEQAVFFEPAPTLQPPTLFKTEDKPQVVERVIERSRNTDKTDFRSVTRSITNYAWRESEAPEPEPSINITIGRVEVRAAPATNTKPTRTRQESPVMPLEEYLRKQRRGGER